MIDQQTGLECDSVRTYAFPPRSAAPMRVGGPRPDTIDGAGYWHAGSEVARRALEYCEGHDDAETYGRAVRQVLSDDESLARYYEAECRRRNVSLDDASRFGAGAELHTRTMKLLARQGRDPNKLEHYQNAAREVRCDPKNIELAQLYAFGAMS